MWKIILRKYKVAYECLSIQIKDIFSLSKCVSGYLRWLPKSTVSWCLKIGMKIVQSKFWCTWCLVISFLDYYLKYWFKIIENSNYFLMLRAPAHAHPCFSECVERTYQMLFLFGRVSTIDRTLRDTEKMKPYS